MELTRKEKLFRQRKMIQKINEKNNITIAKEKDIYLAYIMHSKSDNVEIMTNGKADKVIK